MVKKILLLFLLTITLSSFSQEKSIDKLVASPNPFTNSTTIFVNSKTSQTVILTVRNVLGKTVYSKKLKVINGRNSIPFNRNDLKSGMYIYAIQSNKEVISKRFVIR
ncbi:MULTISPECIES: T9SS type A sorting domain-containing protein [Tenacibaculum]|uniref:T9SS type A sorting domain-containing protein n=1 Tax=Tenacibaculum TaxID=104267 RepID=UPI0021AE6EC7|nr:MULTISPECIES: T9SS type A sorting domain-containing protein [Tenacibaculum]MCT4698035.1 T9SS type A sorting domain-containing protein [Tenacibaculum haliotis]WBX72156.1 T9SS type A sorting domain-containing protein [Tenacibaculum retecalamus]